MLAGKNISCIRGEKTLFSHLSFDIAEGAPFFITGPNGSGKTSLLKILAGLFRPDEGEVQWQNRSIIDNEDYRTSLLYVGHNNAIRPELSVYENLRFWAQLRGEPILIPAALNYFEMEDLADVPCQFLSAGWQRRVALANLISTPCRVWLLDEPATHLDSRAIALLDGLISTRCKQGGVVVLSTHSENIPKSAQLLHLGNHHA